MIKRDYIIIAALLIFIVIVSMLIIDKAFIRKDNVEANTSTYHVTLSNRSDEPGTVEVIKNIGNPNGKRIAYV
ncbi:MAG: hypothetical protein VZR10_04490, partial [Methanobrevibacter sp.]|nr:hypothetical protein [Methanobrevibacter sp.]